MYKLDFFSGITIGIFCFVLVIALIVIGVQVHDHYKCYELDFDKDQGEYNKCYMPIKEGKKVEEWCYND